MEDKNIIEIDLAQNKMKKKKKVVSILRGICIPLGFLGIIIGSLLLAAGNKNLKYSNQFVQRDSKAEILSINRFKGEALISYDNGSGIIKEETIKGVMPSWEIGDKITIAYYGQGNNSILVSTDYLQMTIAIMIVSGLTVLGLGICSLFTPLIVRKAMRIPMF